MTDKEKLEKIVAYLMRRMYAHNQKADIGSTGEIFDEKIENAKYEECRDTLNFIDSMQKEPESHKPKITLGEATGKFKELLDNMKDSAAKDLGLSEEDYNKAIDECLYGKEPELVDDGDLPKEEPKKCMYSKDNYTDKDRKVLCDGCEEECEYVSNIPPVFDEGYWERLGEKPVSEDLIVATNNYCVNVRKGYPRVMDETDRYICNAFKAGAKWQKEKFEKDCTDLCNGIATAKGVAVAMAYNKGMADAKEQMMKDATEVTVHIDAGGYPYIPQMELYDYEKDIPLAKRGDKYKVILIKEGWV